MGYVVVKAEDNSKMGNEDGRKKMQDEKGERRGT